jgi:glutathione S-transferase
MTNISLYGVILSPFVRKVRLALDYKNIEYEKIPVMPMAGMEKPPEFEANSPLGKVPLLRVGDDYISDSSVICAWLEREHSQPQLLPVDNIAAARALWFEEYADSQMVPVIGGHLFAEVVLAKAVFGRDPIQDDIDTAITTEIPAIFNYLESQLSSDYLVGDRLTLADIGVGSLFLTLSHCGYEWDENLWPKVVAYAQRLMNSEIFATALEEEQQVLATFLN